MTATKAWSKRNLRIGGAFVLALAALGACQSVFDRQADSAAGTGVIAPVFEVDPLWPKPLPNHWLLGMTIGIWVDEQDHVWIIHRSSATLHANRSALELGVGECCRGAPPVLEFDQEGNLVRAWGGPGQGYEWPGRITASTSTTRATSGSAATAAQGRAHPEVHQGWQVRHAGRRARQERRQQRSENFGRVAKIWVDPQDQRGLCRRRLSEPAASPCSMPTPAK